VLREDVAVVPYDACWPDLFCSEKKHLLASFPQVIRRIEHFGSTAVPGLPAKPIVDMLIEVSDLDLAQLEIAPALEAQGYDYFWRPTLGDDVPPFYAWFIKRDATRTRTHHLHMITTAPAFAGHWDQLLFRDYLIDHPDTAAEYAKLKLRLAHEHQSDRIAYTAGKSSFIAGIMEKARTERDSR